MTLATLVPGRGARDGRGTMTGEPVVTKAYPVRQRSAGGQPRPDTTIERTCQRCGASFIGLAPGRTGERGLWREWEWFCSVECAGLT